MVGTTEATEGTDPPAESVSHASDPLDLSTKSVESSLAASVEPDSSKCSSASPSHAMSSGSPNRKPSLATRLLAFFRREPNIPKSSEREDQSAPTTSSGLQEERVASVVRRRSSPRNRQVMQLCPGNIVWRGEVNFNDVPLRVCAFPALPASMPFGDVCDASTFFGDKVPDSLIISTLMPLPVVPFTGPMLCINADAADPSGFLHLYNSLILQKKVAIVDPLGSPMILLPTDPEYKSGRPRILGVPVTRPQLRQALGGRTTISPRSRAGRKAWGSFCAGVTEEQSGEEESTTSNEPSKEPSANECAGTSAEIVSQKNTPVTWQITASCGKVDKQECTPVAPEQMDRLILGGS